MGLINDVVYYSLKNRDPKTADLWRHCSPISEPVNDLSIEELRRQTFTMTADEPPLLQEMETINSFLRLQLGLLTADTTIARSCLVNTREIDYWAKDFDIAVGPVIVVFGLPAWNIKR